MYENQKSGDFGENRCNVSGVWVNSLGSVLTLSVEGPLLSGSLRSSVESSAGAAGKEKIGKLVGLLGDGEHATFAMSVMWSGGSVSTWAGQCFLRSHCPVLRTLWLLRSEAGTEDKNWQSTRIGEDTFHPQKACDSEKLS
ncbi:avidin-related protein 4/5-like [Rhinophrynus dorsalis]